MIHIWHINTTVSADYHRSYGRALLRPVAGSIPQLHHQQVSDFSSFLHAEAIA